MVSSERVTVSPVSSDPSEGSSGSTTSTVVSASDDTALLPCSVGCTGCGVDVGAGVGVGVGAGVGVGVGARWK